MRAPLVAGVLTESHKFLSAYLLGSQFPLFALEAGSLLLRLSFQNSAFVVCRARKLLSVIL